LVVEGLADPAQRDAYGLDDPPYRASLTIHPADQEPHQATLLIGELAPGEQNGGRYARLADGDLVYVIPTWAFERIFQAAGKLLEFDVLSASPQDVVRLEVQQDDTSWTLARQEAAPPHGDQTPSSTWQLTADPALPVDATAVSSALTTLSQLRAEDWMPQAPEPTGLERPTVTLALTLRDDGAAYLTLGATRQGEAGGHYLGRRGTPGVFVVSDTTYTALTEALAQLQPSPASPAPSAPPATEAPTSGGPQAPEAPAPAPNEAPAAPEPPAPAAPRAQETPAEVP
jgi:hypothetical protein